MGDRLVRASFVVGGLVFAFLGVTATFAPRPSHTAYHWQVVVPLVLVLLAVGTLGHVPRLLRGRWPPVVVAVAGGLLATVVGQLLRYDYGWDARFVMQIARDLDSGTPLSGAQFTYLSIYPNNLALVWIDRAGAAIGDRLGLSADAVLITLSGVGVAVTLYVVHRIVQPVAGPGAAIGAQAVTLLLVALNPWVSVPYTDLYAMPFVVVGVWAALLASRRTGRWRGLVLLLLAVVAIWVAYMIKTTPVVVIVALVATGIADAFSRRRRAAGAEPAPSPGASAAGPSGRRRAACLAALAGGAVLFVVLAGVGPMAVSRLSGVDSSRLHGDASPPVLWWVANGMNEVHAADGVTAYGGYSGAMVRAISDRSQAQMLTYSREYIDQTSAARGPAGMLGFYADKLMWNWGDSMFGAWGEGRDAGKLPVAQDVPAARTVYAVEGPRGEWFGLRSDVAQAVWAALLLLMGLGLLRARPSPDSVLLAVSVLGITAFTLLFQGRSRYLLTFVPLVAALAGAVHAQAREVVVGAGAFVRSRLPAGWSTPHRTAARPGHTRGWSTLR